MRDQGPIEPQVQRFVSWAGGISLSARSAGKRAVGKVSPRFLAAVERMAGKCKDWVKEKVRGRNGEVEEDIEVGTVG